MIDLLKPFFDGSPPFIIATVPAIIFFLYHLDRKLTKLLARFDQYLDNGGTSTKTLDKIQAIEIRCNKNHPDPKDEKIG